ncbi:MAG: DUF308 domain-containing protein [Gammaproteobacteria bacterium]|jgi:uncharacterized membrane protein HdeD (DUF308 family)
MTETEKLELPLKWGWLLALGLSMVVLGTLGIGLAFYLTLASVILFGALALVAGGFQLWHGMAMQEARWSGRALHLFVALMYLVLGGVLIWDPVSGSVSLTLVLAGFLFALGLSRLLYAWKCRRRRWRWMLSLAGGVIDLLLAGLIVYGWPGTAFWVIGLFVAIELIVNGWWVTGVALTVRRFNRESNRTISPEPDRAEAGS